jgi:hypothetical protein
VTEPFCYDLSKHVRPSLRPCSIPECFHPPSRMLWSFRPVKAPVPVCLYPRLSMAFPREIPSRSPTCASCRPTNHSQYGRCRARRRSSVYHFGDLQIHVLELVLRILLEVERLGGLIVHGIQKPWLVTVGRLRVNLAQTPFIIKSQGRILTSTHRLVYYSLAWCQASKERASFVCEHQRTGSLSCVTYLD